jgi:retron-type reverse transcriptase
VLKEHLHDGRCIKLLQELLDAGYRENWTYNQTLSGVPQGGMVSPILSNILLDNLDTLVETVLIPHYPRGSRRKVNPAYDKVRKDSRNQRRKGNTAKAEEWRKHSQTLPPVMTNDPDYRRLQ